MVARACSLVMWPTADGESAVLDPVGVVDGVVEAVVGVDERDIGVEAARLDVALHAGAGAAIPGGVGPVHGPDVEAVAEADDPDDPGLAQRAVGAAGRDVHLAGVADPRELLAGPGAHGRTITLRASRSAIAR